MDRRQRKSREAIFSAFIALLSRKDYNKITVGEIIAGADVGRATFYAHFETKDYLLKALCEDLFCHILDDTQQKECDHRHMFTCNGTDSVFLHLFQHLQKDDNHILTLLSSRNNDLFWHYFKTNLYHLAESQLPLFAHRKNENLPLGFWVDHIAATFVETVRWWISNGMQESPEMITAYFLAAV